MTNFAPPALSVITLDFETYYDKDYTLSKMTTEEYVRDPRFEVLGVGVRYSHGTTDWLGPEQLHNLNGNQLNLKNSAILCHHAHFDGLILSHHFGIEPAFWFDTLSMARQVHGNHLPKSLAKLSEHYGLPAKNVPYNLFISRHWHELDHATQKLVADGCLHDCDLTWQLFLKMAQTFPIEEYRIIDATIRMFTEPELRGDVDMLGQVWQREEQAKSKLLTELGVSEEELQSAEKFAELLRNEGVEPETKDGKNGPIYAFAKTDEFMKELLDGDDVRVANLVRARLGIKSTLEQTRAERLGFMATRGPMCVYLNYGGAHTTRWSGGDKLNWQNFPARKNNDIRRSIYAPPGHLIFAPDLSQIECRILNYVAGQHDVIEKFACGEDPYVGIASMFYGHEVYKPAKDDPRRQEMEAKRGTGKQLELSCGYQAGAKTIVATARKGIYGPPVMLTEEEGLRARDLYRATHPGVVNYWSQASRMIARIAGGEPLQWGPLLIKDHKVLLPNGCWISYETLEYDEKFKSWKIRKRNGWTKLYGGKLVENVVQAMARVVVSQAMLRIMVNEPRVRFKNLEHDKVVCLLPDNGETSNMVAMIKEELKRAPTWLPGIPLDCEGEPKQRYE